MKIELLKEHIEEASQAAARVSNKNLSLPVLGCVVISATSKKTVLRATNLDISIEMGIKAKVLEEGNVAVPAHVFNQLISASNDQKITLSSDEHTLEYIGNHGTSKLKIIDVSEFPTLPFVKEGVGQSVTLQTKELTTALKSVAFAASTSGIRPELSSVFLKLSEGELTTAATDSFRLAEMKVQTKSRESAEPVLIPARNISEIIRVLGSGDTAEVRIDENQVTFISGGNFITSRVVDGAFPDYRAIFPKTFTTTATALTEDVTKTLRKVSVFTDASGEVEFGVHIKAKSLFFKAANTQVGEIIEEVESALEGDESTLFFNIRYLLDAVGIISSDSTVFKFSGPGKPLIISEVPEKGFTYLVMPMNR